MRFHQVFGSENAETDDLLYECAVDTMIRRYTSPILTGRWGTGKTAVFFLQNDILRESLRKKREQYREEWYLRESSLDIEMLIRLHIDMKHDRVYFRRILEKIWFAEIVRRYTRILALLEDSFTTSSGEHWKRVNTLAKMAVLETSLWTQIPDITGIIFALARGENIKEPMSRVSRSLAEIFDKSSYESVKKCLYDVRKFSISVAVEPIETPVSDVENSQLANDIVASLLNTFRKYFEPSIDNPFYVRIAIPWHRFNVSNLDFPQKIYPYKENIVWSKEELFAFINKRIEWEFRRVGRRYAQNKHPWYVLFPKEVQNGVTTPPVQEDSFSYILRHTHHRPRDLQRLTRSIVKHYANRRQLPVDEVLLKHQIDKEAIKNTLRAECPQIAQLLIEEGQRRYGQLYELVEKLRGLPLPFSQDDLKRRIQMMEMDINRAILMLWDVGILGVYVYTRYNSKLDLRLKNNFPPDMLRIEYAQQNAVCWNWFEYNYTGDPITLLEKIKSLDGEERPLLALHPVTFEYFTPRSFVAHCPIGI